MNSLLCKLWFLLKSKVWLLAAFFVPIAIRSIPEVLSWPYPLGLDTLTMVDFIQTGYFFSDFNIFIHSQLFYSLQTLAYWLSGDVIVTIKVFGPILMASVSLMMYLYARYVLVWSGFKSFLVSLLLAIYFVSLRNSWDLYAQSFALIFLFAALLFLKSSNSTRRYIPAFIFIILTILSHQLVAVILFFVLGLEAIRWLIKGYRGDFLFSFTALGLAGALYLFRIYSPARGTITIPPAEVASTPSVALALNMTGLIVYCYFLLLPFVAVGIWRLKDYTLRLWALWCIGVPVLLMFAPNLPLYYWNRWVYLLVYPLMFFTVEGLDKLWHYCSTCKHNARRLAPKAFAIVYVVLLLALSGFYLSASPENQVPLFSTHNPYLSFIPSSMVQNMISVKDNLDLVNCVNWLNNNKINSSILVEHYALYDLVKIYGADLPVINVRHGFMWAHLQNETNIIDSIVFSSKEALISGNNTVFTVWWVDGQGWYGLVSLPSDFNEVYRSGEIAVYIFNSNA